jgi:hypothetical protein
MTKPRRNLHQSISKEKTMVSSGPEGFKFLFGLNKERLCFHGVAFGDMQMAKNSMANRYK